MRKLFAFSETVYDIIFKDNVPVEGRPGGAMLNTAISLGRLNAPVYLITGNPDDRVGDIVHEFLIENNVAVDYVTRYKNARSRLALAFLDNNRNADYNFYKLRMDEKTSLVFPEVTEDDIVMFGSYYAIKPEIRNEVSEFLQYARQKNALLIYDPNFRQAHIPELMRLKPYIDDNIRLAHIVKGSNEDFYHIYKTNDIEATKTILLGKGVKHLIYTANKYGVYLKSNSIIKHYPVPEIEPISTVGAGDSFNAGLMYALLKNNVKANDLDNMTENNWNDVLKVAIEFGTHSCMSFDNYISEEFAETYLK